ncbi:unnamed protein product [Prorocentrum cordatum]|uniref:Uncharacterized protein n=1 Tax=Prorocentrum cordatum TaxID=2364126 RepID=A0ABN9UPW0_9DINO|nr:unnamed protein product [Polarella glacialis]
MAAGGRYRPPDSSLHARFGDATVLEELASLGRTPGRRGAPQPPCSDPRRRVLIAVDFPSTGALAGFDQLTVSVDLSVLDVHERAVCALSQDPTGSDLTVSADLSVRDVHESAVCALSQDLTGSDVELLPASPAPTKAPCTGSGQTSSGRELHEPPPTGALPGVTLIPAILHTRDTRFLPTAQPPQVWCEDCSRGPHSHGPEAGAWVNPQIRKTPAVSHRSAYKQGIDSRLICINCWMAAGIFQRILKRSREGREGRPRGRDRASPRGPDRRKFRFLGLGRGRKAGHGPTPPAATRQLHARARQGESPGSRGARRGHEGGRRSCRGGRPGRPGFGHKGRGGVGGGGRGRDRGRCRGGAGEADGEETPAPESGGGSRRRGAGGRRHCGHRRRCGCRVRFGQGPRRRTAARSGPEGQTAQARAAWRALAEPWGGARSSGAPARRRASRRRRRRRADSAAEGARRAAEEAQHARRHAPGAVDDADEELPRLAEHMRCGTFSGQLEKWEDCAFSLKRGVRVQHTDVYKAVAETAPDDVGEEAVFPEELGSRIDGLFDVLCQRCIAETLGIIKTAGCMTGIEACQKLHRRCNRRTMARGVRLLGQIVKPGRVQIYIYRRVEKDTKYDEFKGKIQAMVGNKILPR